MKFNKETIELFSDYFNADIENNEQHKKGALKILKSVVQMGRESMQEALKDYDEVLEFIDRELSDGESGS